MMKHYVGIDMGERTHHVCVMTHDERVISEHQVTADQAGLDPLMDLLAALGEVEINVERPNGLWVMALLERDLAVFVTPPHVVHKRRPRRSKDDRGDAWLLAQLRCRGDADSRPVQVPSPHAEELRQWVQAHDQAQTHQRRITGQLRAVLHAYYPARVDLFSSLSQPLTLAFLTVFPTPDAARTATLDEFYAFFEAQHYRWMERVPTFYQRLQQPTLAPRVMTGYQAQMLTLVALLQTLDARLKTLRRHMLACFEAHPDAAWWRAWPGAGQLTAVRLLAYLGDNPARWPSDQALQAIAGTAPVTRRSGKKTVVEFRLACSRSLRRVAIDFARISIRHSGWACSYFRDQLARGHDPTRAFRALANRWLKILWTVWQHGDTYDEARHVANRSRQGQPAPTPL